jgi:hypothetical protein
MKFFLLIIFAIGIASLACKSEITSPPAKIVPPPKESSSPVPVANEQPSNCPLTKALAPVVNGLRLGMTSEEVFTVLPGSRNDPELEVQLKQSPSRLGVSSFIIHTESLESKQKFAGINQFTFNLLDGRVYSLNIGYDGPAYSNVDEFVTKFVQGTHLPPAEKWQAATGLDNQMKTLTCKDFEIRVFAGGEGGKLNYVLLTDLDAAKQLKDRRATARAQSTPTATP